MSLSQPLHYSVDSEFQMNKSQHYIRTLFIDEGYKGFQRFSSAVLGVHCHQYFKLAAFYIQT